MKFYMHAGSLNHGCEAIIRSTASMISEEIELYSEHSEEDEKVHLGELCTVIDQGHARNKKDIGFALCKLLELLFHSDAKYKYLYKNILSNTKETDICVSIGGDNYCYGNNPNLIYLNRILNAKGCKTVLWGCSIEPKSLYDPELIADMKRYALITARESITYEALLNAGISRYTYLFPDPAFSLETETFDMSKIPIRGGWVGINVSPLVRKKETKEGMILQNYSALIKYIIHYTQLNVLLIPHVCKKESNDNEILKLLFDEFVDSCRVFRINETGNMNCRQLKYAISRCRYTVVARTHASIAAYSTGVPTLVVGYSVKAKGIARDLFGSADNYVVDVESIKKEDDLKNDFVWMVENEVNIKKRLELMMPDYIDKSRTAGDLLNKICRGEDISHGIEN